MGIFQELAIDIAENFILNFHYKLFIFIHHLYRKSPYSVVSQRFHFKNIGFYDSNKKLLEINKLAVYYNIYFEMIKPETNDVPK